MNDFAAAAKVLARLNFVVCGGGGLKESVGMALESQNVTLVNHFGATELGALAPIFQPDSGYDWRYLRVRSDLGVKLEILEHESHSCKLVGYPFAWDSEFELQDRLEYNPFDKSEVKILGRNDDVLVLATGEKVLPHPLERALEQHPSVHRAIVFGSGQFELGLLVEPINERATVKDFVEEIWPSILSANTLMDSHAWISTKFAIIVKPPGKDIPLSDKGSVRRKEVYQIFESEITSVYAKLECAQTNENVAPFDFVHAEDTLRSMVQSCLPSRSSFELSNSDEDFLNLGMDSLKATKLRRMLNAALRNSSHTTYNKQDLPLDFIYAHPSISRLAKALNSPINDKVLAKDRTEVMKYFVSKYAISDVAVSLERPKCVVVLTGSTGNLGAHLLAQLTTLDNVNRIVCLLRHQLSPSTADIDNLVERQSDALKGRRIQLSKTGWSKVQFLPWNVDEDFLGLGQDGFQSLASQVTHVFHGAWPMDFNLKLSSFEPQIKAVRGLVELCRAAHRRRPDVRPRFVLASSIAVVGQYFKVSSSGAIVPEALMDDSLATLPLGYAEAKWCCEKVIESAHASIPHEMESVILRIGQLSGSQTTGFWSEKEHIAAFVKACQDVQAMPNLQGVSII